MACRNCVIDSKLCIKISHSAASQDIYKDEYVEHSNQVNKDDKNCIIFSFVAHEINLLI